MVPVCELFARPPADKIQGYHPPLNLRAMLPREAWNLRGKADLTVPDRLSQTREPFRHDRDSRVIHSGVSVNSHIIESSA